ncbi:FCD domain-containing protein [Asticcacaulis sp. BYS171W]|uniref:FCD domain-containing protein n=1 Tax=Asticcacaulis aquaticus TaxID=2984212 RepID=A0ABT5HXM3_9CAUL|nr:FCD domain-containing protein [Asticcacaulis aquaticus]MDC7684605.1 FCD domain-containing protein [Asticcacaulis aquaticus]
MATEDRDRRFYQVIGESLSERIRAGEFSLGGRLPPERELAEAYNVGRTVIRDALVMLEVKGLVEIRQGSGIYVTRRAYEAVAPEDVTIEMRPPAGPFELLQARQWLESHMARLAALNATEADLAAIREACEDHRTAAWGEAKESMDIRFHMAIARAAQNSELTALVAQLWHRRDHNPMWRSLHGRIRDTTYRQRWVRDHEAIVAALTRRDPEAAYVAMWSHIENVKNFLMNAADVEDDATPVPLERKDQAS